MQPHPDQVAARLGLDETTIARLRARGRLERLALTQPEIRERLYRAHLAYLDAQRRSTQGGGRAKAVGSTVLILNPTKAGRRWMAAGENHHT
jgi:hypothetical protein